jgi:hypothetical protein
VKQLVNKSAIYQTFVVKCQIVIQFLKLTFIENLPVPGTTVFFYPSDEVREWGLEDPNVGVILLQADGKRSTSIVYFL